MCRHINVYISHSLGKTDDAKASEKGKSPLKGSSLQRSPSDAGKSSGDEGKKPPSGIGRSTATGSFGFKKPSGVGSSAMITSSGATITSGSATLGKIPKSAAIGGSQTQGGKPAWMGPRIRTTLGCMLAPKPPCSTEACPAHPNPAPVAFPAEAATDPAPAVSIPMSAASQLVPPPRN